MCNAFLLLAIGLYIFANIGVALFSSVDFEVRKTLSPHTWNITLVGSSSRALRAVAQRCQNPHYLDTLIEQVPAYVVERLPILVEPSFTLFDITSIYIDEL